MTAVSEDKILAANPCRVNGADGDGGALRICPLPADQLRLDKSEVTFGFRDKLAIAIDLPTDARDTGYRNDELELWLSRQIRTQHTCG